VKARDFENGYLLPEDGKKPVQAQEATYAWLKGLKRRQQRKTAGVTKPRDAKKQKSQA
jgi:polyphosphate kinase